MILCPTSGGVRITSREIPVDHPETLCGPALELEVDREELRREMRAAADQPSRVSKWGKMASQHALAHYTWQQTAAAMKKRIEFLAGRTNIRFQVRSLKQHSLTARIRCHDDTCKPKTAKWSWPIAWRG